MHAQRQEFSWRNAPAIDGCPYCSRLAQLLGSQQGGQVKLTDWAADAQARGDELLFFMAVGKGPALVGILLQQAVQFLHWTLQKAARYVWFRATGVVPHCGP